MLFDHSCLVHNNTLELAVSQLFGTCLTDGRYDDRGDVEDLLFKCFLITQELEELSA